MRGKPLSWCQPDYQSNVPVAGARGRAGAIGGARLDRPRHSRMAVIADGVWIAASIRIRDWQRGHSRTSTAKTRLIKYAQAWLEPLVRSWDPVQADAASSSVSCAGCAGTTWARQPADGASIPW